MSKRFIAFMIGAFVLVGAGFFYVLYQGSELHPQQVSGLPRTSTASANHGLPAPNVTLSVERTKDGNVLFVQWNDLPGNTAALAIFRSAKGKSDWSLWKTITLLAAELGGGNAQFNIGKDDLSTYSFYVEAIGNNNSNGGGNSTSTTILWTSPPTDAPIVVAPQNPSSPPSEPSEPAQGSPSSSPSSSVPVTPPAPSSSTPVTPPPGTSSSPVVPNGTPYYTPEIQISGYESGPSDNFWVQHIDQMIQIGWQNLPPQTTGVVIVRSLGEDGPWTTVFTQENPDTANPYSIQVVDNTLGQPYYYELNGSAGSTTDAVYGPVYLPSVGQ